MLEQPRIELQDIARRVDGDWLVLDVKVHNPEDRTLYAYVTPRRIAYDAATQTLTVSLHDQHITDDHPMAPRLRQPRFAALEGQAVTNVSISIPRVLRRILAASERQPGGPMVEVQTTSDATSATIEMAHQDTPYYYNPRAEKAEQLRTWGAQVATLSAPVSGSPSEAPDG